jgi:hypothetical protein
MKARAERAFPPRYRIGAPCGIKHHYDPIDGLTTPKNSKERKIFPFEDPGVVAIDARRTARAVDGVLGRDPGRPAALPGTSPPWWAA